LPTFHGKSDNQDEMMKFSPAHTWSKLPTVGTAKNKFQIVATLYYFHHFIIFKEKE